MAASAPCVHFSRRRRLGLSVLLALGAAVFGCDRKPRPADNIPIVGPTPLEPVAQKCTDAAAPLLTPEDIEATCGLLPNAYLGIGVEDGCQYIFQTGPDRAYVRMQTRVGMTVKQAFEGVSVRPVTGIGDFAQEGSIRGDLWIVAAQRGNRLAYVEADRRLCSEQKTATLLAVSTARLGAGPASAPATAPSTQSTR